MPPDSNGWDADRQALQRLEPTMTQARSDWSRGWGLTMLASNPGERLPGERGERSKTAGQCRGGAKMSVEDGGRTRQSSVPVTRGTPAAFAPVAPRAPVR